MGPICVNGNKIQNERADMMNVVLNLNKNCIFYVHKKFVINFGR